MTRVLVVGEINVDLICSGYTHFPQPGKEVLVDDLTVTLGSSSAICAMGLAKLGVDVRYVGVVGADVWGQYCVEVMRAAGIDVSRVRTDPNLKTGATISITSQRDRALVSYLGAVSALRAEHVDDEAFHGADHLHISSYYLQQGLRRNCSELLDRAAGAGLSISLDPGFDPTEQWGCDLLRVLREVDLFFPNEVELHAITRIGETAAALRSLDNGRTRTVVTLGAQGSATLGGVELLQIPAFRIQSVVDSTGAGDSFNAGFLRAWLHKLPIVECMRWGAVSGALSTRGLGGTLQQGTAAEIAAILADWPTAP